MEEEREREKRAWHWWIMIGVVRKMRLVGREFVEGIIRKFKLGSEGGWERQ